MNDVTIFIEMLRLAEQMGKVTSAAMIGGTFFNVGLNTKDGCDAVLKLEKGAKG